VSIASKQKQKKIPKNDLGEFPSINWRQMADVKHNLPMAVVDIATAAIPPPICSSEWIKLCFANSDDETHRTIKKDG